MQAGGAAQDGMGCLAAWLAITLSILRTRQQLNVGSIGWGECREAKEHYETKDAKLLVADCLGMSLAQLQQTFSVDTALWLHAYLRGEDERAVAS